jgi:hypothetical protein
VGDGTAAHLLLNALAQDFSGDDKPLSITILTQHLADVLTSADVFWAFGNAGNGNPRHNGNVTQNENYNSVRQGDTGSADTDTTSQTYSDTAWRVINWSFTGTAVTIRVNDALTSVNAASHNVVAATFDRHALMALISSGTASNWLDGKLSAVVYSTAVLSDANRTAITAALMARAGV